MWSHKDLIKGLRDADGSRFFFIILLRLIILNVYLTNKLKLPTSGIAKQYIASLDQIQICKYGKETKH